MKLIIATIALLGMTAAASAQSTSNAASGSAAYNKNLNASVSGAAGNTIEYNANGGDVRYNGAYDLRNVPAITPPGFSSGHPCAYAPISFGAGWVGAGASAGGQVIDDACLLAQMGYTQEAMQMIAARNKVARAALQRTGKVARATPAPASASASSKAPARPVALLTKCENLGNNRIKVRYTAAGRKNKAAAVEQCKQHLGM